MKETTKLVKNFLVYIVGNIGSKLISFLFLPLYTFYLNPGDYGYVDLVISTVSLIMPLCMLQVNDGLLRLALESEDKNSKNEVIVNAFIIVFRNLVLLITGFLIASQFLNIRYVDIIVFYFILSVISSLAMCSCRAFKKNALYSVVGVIHTVVLVISNIVLIVYFNYGIKAILISNCVACIADILIIFICLKLWNLDLSQYNNKNMRRQLLIISVPTIPSYINWWITNVSGRFVIAHYMGNEANGIYAIATKFPTIVTIFSSMFNLAWQESAIENYDSEDKGSFYSNIFNNLYVFMFTLIIGVIPVTKYIMTILINEKYDTAWMYVPFLYIAAVYSLFSTFYGTSFLCAKNTMESFYSSLYGSLINVGANFLLIPYIGIQGASISTMLSFVCTWLARIKSTNKYFSIKINWFKFILLNVITGVYVYLYYIENISIQFISIFLSGVIFIAFNKDMLRAVLSKMLKMAHKVRLNS